MHKNTFKNATFIKTALKPEDYPLLRHSSGMWIPEIALVGRSNVGKSTLINHLFQSKGLAKTSSTPGKTQAIQFFSLNHTLTFVDLPGYGFASAPKHVQSSWGEMMEQYLSSREPLKLLLLLQDIRRTPQEEDLLMPAWCQRRNLPFLLVLTKVDKVTKSERETQTKRILQFYPTNTPHVHYSALKNEGRDALIKWMSQCLA